jgi:hypothetical protein
MVSVGTTLAFHVLMFFAGLFAMYFHWPGSSTGRVAAEPTELNLWMPYRSPRCWSRPPSLPDGRVRGGAGYVFDGAAGT